MTRRDFDAATRENWGGPFMASDERAAYRAARHRDAPGVDRLAVRAAYLRRRGRSPLWIGSPHRAPALYRAGLHPCSPGRRRD